MATFFLIIHILNVSFYLDVILFNKIVHENPILVDFFRFFSFFLCILVFISRNSLFVQHDGL